MKPCRNKFREIVRSLQDRGFIIRYLKVKRSEIKALLVEAGYIGEPHYDGLKLVGIDVIVTD